MLLIVVSWVTGSIDYKGDTLNYLWKEKIILLTGNAEVKTQEVVAKADTIKYDANKNIVSAFGNPILWIGSQKIEGERMVYDLETGEGLIQNGRTQIQKGWFDGRIIKKVEKNVLNINYGKFTTCDHNPPHYYFWGKELKVYIDNMVFTRPLILFVHDIPLFYAPFWWFPIKKGRQSGLLHPKIGRSSEWGKYAENISYYWVINSWSDATVTLNYYEHMGPRVLLEGRWLLSSGDDHLRTGAGNFNTSYMIEKNEKKRWALDFTHSQVLGNRLSLKTDGHFISDIQYKVDYEEERLVQLDKILDSYFSISKSWDLISTSFLIQERRDLSRDIIPGDTIITKIQRALPSISYSLNPKRIGGGYFSWSGTFKNSSSIEQYKQRSDRKEEHRISQNTASLSFPFKLFRYLSVSPTTSHSYTLQEPDRLAKPYHSTHSIALSTNIYGKTIFKPELRHIMTPRLSYSIVDTTHSCAFSISNNFQLMIGEKKIALARLDLSSGWSFVQDRINPISISIFSTPFRLLNLQAYGTYRFYEDKKFKFDRLVLSSYYSRRDFSLSVIYNWVPRTSLSDKSLQLELNTKLTKNWRLSLSRRYDLLTQKVISERFSIYRDLHCWDMVFNFDRYGETWRYDFQIKLKAIPEIKVTKSIFGIFL